MRDVETAVKIGSTPINWWDNFPLTPVLKPTPATILQQMKEIGYAGTELGGVVEIDDPTLPDLLKQNELEMIGGIWPTFFLSDKHPIAPQAEKFKAFLDALNNLGASVVQVAEATFNIVTNIAAPVFSTQIPVLTDVQWSKLGEGLETFNELAQSHGLKMAYHPHVGTVVANLDQINCLLDVAPNVNLVADTGHLAYLDIDPLEFIQTHSDRIVHFHLKNIRPEVLARVHNEQLSWRWSQINGIFSVPGDGGINFKPILQTIKEMNFEGWIVLEAEQDSHKADPYLYAKLGREYVQLVSGW